MAKTLLRSGNLDAVIALGENGQPVYLLALQLRETLRLRKQSQIADCLAIPQLNEAGDRLDWYSPVAGKVSAWAAASSCARSAALNQLRCCQVGLDALSKQSLQASQPGQRLFGRLLSKVLHFPTHHCVYLVDGHPVITFWGFDSLEKNSPHRTLDCLLLEQDDQAPTLSYAQTAPVPLINAAAPAAHRSPRNWPRYIWALLPLLALLLTLLCQQQGGTASDAGEAPRVVAGSTRPAAAAPGANITLPLSFATFAAAPVSASPEVEQPAVNKNDLVLPAASVRAGSVSFLNGSWQVVPQRPDGKAASPVRLNYQLRNGKGSVRIIFTPEVSCRALVFAGLMPSGRLVINSRSRARCSDGSAYHIPQLVCTQGNPGAAVCHGRYSDNTLLPMSIRRKS